MGVVLFLLLLHSSVDARKQSNLGKGPSSLLIDVRSAVEETFIAEFGSHLTTHRSNFRAVERGRLSTPSLSAPLGEREGVKIAGREGGTLMKERGILISFSLSPLLASSTPHPKRLACMQISPPPLPISSSSSSSSSSFSFSRALVSSGGSRERFSDSAIDSAKGEGEERK